MGPEPRFAVFFDQHIGVGIRWSDFAFTLHLSISVPFVTMTIGLGKRHD